MSAKFIFVTGGVVSSLGKGLAAASLGCLLESRGLKVSQQKFDPYLNIDPGTMSPFQHGEVFVTDDGAETDLDLGHYERFTHAPLSQVNNLTSGRIYENIITRERRGDYLGKTVQVIPHVTNEIKAACRKVAADVDVSIVEIGGTVGDIESLPFIEAIRQMRHEEGRENTLFVHLTLVPWIAAAQELKTKPTQHRVKELRAIGIQPDILLFRTERHLPDAVRVNIEWIESERMAWPDCRQQMRRFDGILVPGGFGKRGVGGMLHAIRCAREDKIPYFGICLGMQTMVIEFARNVCGLPDADSTEFNPATPHRVIYKLRELKGVDELGGTMRLGAYPCLLAEDSFAVESYGKCEISERHRHRYEFNREFEEPLTAAGMRFTGQTPDGVYVEICEIPDHPWCLGCQFHPEFKSKPLEPHPLFTAFLRAALEHRRKKSRLPKEVLVAHEYSHAE